MNFMDCFNGMLIADSLHPWLAGFVTRGFVCDFFVQNMPVLSRGALQIDQLEKLSHELYNKVIIMLNMGINTSE